QGEGLGLRRQGGCGVLELPGEHLRPGWFRAPREGLRLPRAVLVAAPLGAVQTLELEQAGHQRGLVRPAQATVEERLQAGERTAFGGLRRVQDEDGRGPLAQADVPDDPDEVLPVGGRGRDTDQEGVPVGPDVFAEGTERGAWGWLVQPL